MSASSHSDSSCVFCQIINKSSPAEILYEDSEIIVFKDIRPAATHHYLGVPKRHIKSIKSMQQSDTPLLERLITFGKEVLRSDNGDEEDLLMGFHWPPFNSVDHLHLHIISPASKMSLWSRQVFKPKNMWFVTADYAVAYLQNKLWYDVYSIVSRYRFIQ